VHDLLGRGAAPLHLARVVAWKWSHAFE
jgi:hypothetical protein